MFKSFRRESSPQFPRLAGSFLAALFFFSTQAFAQKAAEPAPNITTGPNFIIDAMLAAAIIGGAIYAVCRPSRRV